MSPLNLETYTRFTELLNSRIETRQHLTEDSVRYAFFLAVMQTTSIQQHEVILELPHPHFPGKEVDTYVQASPGRHELFVEFKFHRTSKGASPKPQKAGSLFKDISRLSSLMTQDRQCIVVYLTCPEMATYFDKNEASYCGFWKEPTGGEFVFDESFVSKTTDTFRKASSPHHGARVGVEYGASLMHDYKVRVFNVRKI